jgi:hypothetical protein
MNLGLLFNYRGGFVGWASMPFMLIFEWLGPFVELFGYIIIIYGFIVGIIPVESFFILFGVAIVLSLLLSVVAVLLDEMSFHVYKRTSDLVRLFIAAIAENIIYRQLNTIWRVWGIFQWLFVRQGTWGKIKRQKIWRSLGED